MAGGTTFHFVTGDIEEALQRAKQAAGDKVVKSEAVFLRCGNICGLG
jgi:hypothetical protein